MNNDRYYQKGNPEKDLLKSVAREAQPVAFDNATNITAPVSSYTKPEPTLYPKSLIVVYSGGEVREKQYFQLIMKNPSVYPNIKIKFISDHTFEVGGEPKIINVAVRKTKEYKETVNDDKPDKYFLVSDVDHFKDFLPGMKQKCVANDIELIISNPCFEVWLYYTEKDDKCIHFEPPSQKNKISSEFKKWVSIEIKGGIDTTNAILRIEQNIENAKKNYSVDDDEIPSLFSTQMFILAEQLLPYVLEGNSKILNARSHRGRRSNNT